MQTLDIWSKVLTESGLKVNMIKSEVMAVCRAPEELHVTAKSQEIQPSLTNHATHLCKCNGVADLIKIPLPICQHAEFGCSRSNRVRISSGEPAKLDSTRARLPWDPTWLTA